MENVLQQQLFVLEMQGVTFEADCTILDEDGEILIRVSVPEAIQLQDPLFHEKDVTLKANSLTQPVSCFVRESRNAMSFPPQQITLFLKPKKSPVAVIYREGDIDTVRLELTGFGKGYLPNGLQLQTPTWTATFASTDEKRSGNYTIEINSLASPLSLADGKRAVDCLWQFLSFCQGHRVKLSDVMMLRGNSIVSAEFGSTHSSRRNAVDSWFCDTLNQELPKLFTGYYALIESGPGWYKTLHDVLYWVSRANISDVGSDGTLILLQVALERLAWHYLAIVPDLSAVQMKRLDGKKAASRIAAMLRELKVPLAIPASFEGLRCNSSTPDDGAITLTELRNDLVHPARKSRPITSENMYYACELARWYLELSLLALCGYNGKYQNRTKLPRWRGDVVPVPWL